MIIGDRLRTLREEKNLSQGDVEKRTGLLRCYISRVENGHTVPAVETLEKFARALQVPLYLLFYDGEEPPQMPNLPYRKTAGEIVWGSSGKDARVLSKFLRLLGRIEEGEPVVRWVGAWSKSRRLGCCVSTGCEREKSCSGTRMSPIFSAALFS